MTEFRVISPSYTDTDYMMRYGFLFILAVLFMPAVSFAQGQGGGARAGIVYGYSVPDADNTKARRTWGVLGSAMLGKSFRIGGYYILADKAQGTGGRQFDLSIHGLEAAYSMASGKGDTFFGLRAGLSKLNTRQSSVDLVFSPYHWGIVSGYDYNWLSMLSIGFEGSLMSFDDSTTSNSGTLYTEDQFRMINFAVTAKIKF